MIQVGVAGGEAVVEEGIEGSSDGIDEEGGCGQAGVLYGGAVGQAGDQDEDGSSEEVGKAGV